MADLVCFLKRGRDAGPFRVEVWMATAVKLDDQIAREGERRSEGEEEGEKERARARENERERARERVTGAF